MERIQRRIIQKDFKDPDSYNGVAHLEPDILECEFKWALVKRFWLSYLKSQKMMLLVLHSICQQIWKTQQWPQDWKSSVFIPIPKKDNSTNVQIIAKGNAQNPSS